jgi:hypothetical protein
MFHRGTKANENYPSPSPSLKGRGMGRVKERFLKEGGIYVY